MKQDYSDIYSKTIPIKRWKFPDQQLTLAGYSRAGAATYFYVPELKIQLDMGGFCREFQPIYFFVTHSHADHALYLPDAQPAGYLTENRKTSSLFVPKEMAPYARKYLHSAQELNNSREMGENEKPYTMHEVVANQIYDLEKNHKVKIIECFHSVPTVGYAFYEVRNKLKEEYKKLSGKEIGELKKKGVNVTDEQEIYKFVFLGDTTAKVFENDELWKYPVLIVECTFLLDEHKDAAEPAGHLHWESVYKEAKAHPQTVFVLIHWSGRYKNEEIEEFFNSQSDLPKNIYPWITSIK